MPNLVLKSLYTNLLFPDQCATHTVDSLTVVYNPSSKCIAPHPTALPCVSPPRALFTWGASLSSALSLMGSFAAAFRW